METTLQTFEDRLDRIRIGSKVKLSDSTETIIVDRYFDLIRLDGFSRLHYVSNGKCSDETLPYIVEVL